MQLHDFALSKGLLDKMPDFGRQLRETTERFLSLARDASDDEAKDGESKAGSGSPTEHRPSNDRPHRDSPGRTNSAEPAEAVPPPEPDTGTEENPKTLYGGLMLSYEPPPTQVAFTPSIPTTSTRTTLPTTFAHSPTPNPYDNPFPIPTLPPPTTYANHETTFGRRLQRYAIEQALLLITMPSPPQQFLARVFGFCLLLESPQTIHRRLRRMLGREAGETLDNWRYPFFHLGGAGTHFEVLGGEGGEVGLRMGNRGTVEVDKPGVTAGFATGPFEVGVGAVRDGGLVDRDMRMVLPGFAGEYFDCDEAEVYLYRRGVVMTPGEDVVTVEVDVGDVEFGRLAGDEDGYGGWGAGRVWKARTVDRYSGSSSSGSGLSPVSSSSGGAMVDMPLLSTQLQDVSGGGWSMDGDAIVDPVLADVFAQQASFVSPTTTGEASTALYSSGSEGGAMLPFGVLVSDGSGNSGYGLTMTQSPNRRRVDVDVMKMMKGMYCRGLHSIVFTDDDLQNCASGRFAWVAVRGSSKLISMLRFGPRYRLTWSKVAGMDLDWERWICSFPFFLFGDITEKPAGVCHRCV